jgi:hypothetical protein
VSPANASVRPLAVLKDQPYERAIGARKRSSAEGVGCVKDSSPRPRAREAAYEGVLPFRIVTSRCFDEVSAPSPMPGAPEAGKADEHHSPGRQLGNAGGWGRRREVEGRRAMRNDVADDKVAARGPEGSKLRVKLAAV